MSKYAKTHDQNERKQYIVEEQVSIAFWLVLILGSMTIIGSGSDANSVFHKVWSGIFILPKMGFYIAPILNGMAAACVGIFGTLVFLDRRENTFCITAIQSSSIIAGMITTILLFVFYGGIAPTVNKFASVILVISAIILLSFRDRVENIKLINKGRVYE